MKTKWIIGCFLLFISLTATAQSKEAFFKYGVKAGYDMSPVDFTPATMLSQFESKYQAGVFLQIGKTIYVQPEAYYVGASTPMLRVPIMVGLRVIDLEVISLHLMGGPVCTTSFSDLQQGFNFNNVTYNWQVGAGVDIFGFITADVRYTLKDNVDIINQVTQFDANTDMLNVTVGLKF